MALLVTIDLKKAAIAAVGFALAWWLVKDTDIYLNFFGLDAENTVYEFRTASMPDRMHFWVNKCRNGVCLTDKDWACGYEVLTVDDDRFDTCFGYELQKAQAWERLGDILLRCGQRLKKFTGTYGDPERCKALQ